MAGASFGDRLVPEKEIEPQRLSRAEMPILRQFEDYLDREVSCSHCRDKMRERFLDNLAGKGNK